MADRRPLKILYIALRDSGSCRSRRIGLEKLGHRLEIVNFFDHVKTPHSLAASIYARTLCGPAVSSFNRAILRRAKENHYHWAWVDKGTMVFPRVIRAVKSTGLFTIHHMNDDFFNPRYRTYFRNMKRAILDYHVHLTSNMCNVRELREMGAPHAIQTHLGFDPEFMWPEGEVPAGRHRYRTDVTFVGFWRPHIDDYLVPLVEQGIDFRSWVPGSIDRPSACGTATDA